MPNIKDNLFFDTVSSYKDESLRDYQRDCKLNIYDLWKTNDSIMLQMPTGTGKTKLFVSIMNDFAFFSMGKDDKDCVRSLIITHRDELVKQIYRELKYFYKLDCSIINSKSYRYQTEFCNISVASIQTLNRRLWAWGEGTLDFIIVDEAHHCLAKTYKKVLRNFPGAKILGLTATPYRLNGVGFTTLFDKILISPSIGDFIKAGWLSNYAYYSLPKDNYITQDIIDKLYYDKYGDYATRSLERQFNTTIIRAKIIANYLKYAKGKKGIIYTISRQHNNRLCREFQKIGIRAKGIDSCTNSDDRARIVNEFKCGTVQILCNVNIFTEGFDCPDIEFIMLARATTSLALYLQQVGRGLRLSENKDKVIIIDTVGLYNKFGLPSDKRNWTKYFIGDSDETAINEEIQEVAKNRLYSLSNRDSDLSEGNEEILLIEDTGSNECIEQYKQSIIDSRKTDIDIVVKEIFILNESVVKEEINNWKDNRGLTFKAETVEDLFWPVDTISINHDDSILAERVQAEYKPVVVDGQLEYEQYEDIKDLIEHQYGMMLKIYLKRLKTKQEENYRKLYAFTISEVMIYFEQVYGKEHRMTKKLNSFLEDYYYNEPVWEEYLNSNLKYRSEKDLHR